MVQVLSNSYTTKPTQLMSLHIDSLNLFSIHQIISLKRKDQIIHLFKPFQMVSKLLINKVKPQGSCKSSMNSLFSTSPDTCLSLGFLLFSQLPILDYPGYRLTSSQFHLLLTLFHLLEISLTPKLMHTNSTSRPHSCIIFSPNVK